MKGIPSCRIPSLQVGWGFHRDHIHPSLSLSPILLIGQGSPTPGPWKRTGPWPARNRAAQQEVSGGLASEASSAAPHCSPWLTTAPPTPSVEKLSSTKPVPGAKTSGDRCYRSRLQQHLLINCLCADLYPKPCLGNPAYNNGHGS